jgi:phosphoglycerate dehydrogenase-like enzyme
MAGMKSVLVTLPITDAHRAQLEQAVMQSGTPCALMHEPDPTDEQLAGVHGIIGMVPVERLAAATSLEWLQLSWAGAGPYCAPGALPAGVVLTNASGAYGLTCSEHMVAFTFELVRRFPEYHRNHARHGWEAAGPITSVEGSTVVVLGMGDIGGSYARKMHALGARVIGVARTAHETPACAERMATVEELDEVLPEADIVAMALPGAPGTEHIIDERRLRLMKPGAFLLNVGRGNAIDPAGLKAVLADGLLGGVALDVTEPEPLPPDDELWDYDRVFITPHVSGQLFLTKTLDNVIDIAAANLQAWLSGQPLTHVVNRELGY